jgi:hypothetical protein
VKIGRTRKDWALLFRAITNRDHVNELFIVINGHILRLLVRNVDTHVLHCIDAPWVKALGMSASATDIELVASHLSKQPLRHLTSRRIAGAQKKDGLPKSPCLRAMAIS